MPSSVTLGSSNLITLEQTGLWLSKGWRDLQRAPGLSFLFGGLYPLIGILSYVVLHQFDLDSLVILLASGFMLVGPLAATCLYEVARRLETGEPLSAGLVLAAVRQRATAIGDMGLILMMILLSWLVIGFVMFALFFSGAPPQMDDFVLNMLFNPAAVPFILSSIAVGGCLAALVFSISMFAMPMMIDKDVTAYDAISFSVRAVWKNRLNMIGWAATLVVLTVFGMSVAFVGLIVVFPVVAYASWHAYRDVAG